jgi:hypothetical protein
MSEFAWVLTASVCYSLFCFSNFSFSHHTSCLWCDFHFSVIDPVGFFSFCVIDFHMHWQTICS